MRQSHLILSNATIMWATQVFNLVPQLIFVPYLIGAIGENGYGIYALVWSLMLSIDQLEMSLQQGVVKYSAGFLAQGRMNDVNKVVSSCFIYSILLAVAACAGSLGAATFYRGSTSQIGTVLVVVGIMVLFIVPLTPYVAVIQSRQRYYVGAIAATLSKYVSLLAVVVWFRAVAPSVEALIGIMAGILFLSRLAQVPVAYRLVPGLRNRPRLFNWGSFRLIAVFGAATVLLSLSLAANSTGIRWLMGALVSTSFVAHLAIMLMPGLLLSQIIYAMTLTIMPATSAFEATGNQRMLRELLIRGMRYTTILVLAGMITAGLLMRKVLAAWVGSRYEFLAPYALALFVSVSFALSTSSVHHMLKGMGKLRTVVFIYLIGLVIVPVGVILVTLQIRQDPYAAVTLGLVAGNLVCGCLHIGFGVKAVHADLRELFKRVYAQPFMIAVAVSLAAFGIVAISGMEALVGRACISVFAILLFFGGCYLFIANAAERKQFKEFRQIALEKVAAMRRMRPRPKQP